MRNRQEKIDYLLREIGEIDDRLLDEAITYKPSRIKTYRLGLIAACIALACFMAIAAPLIRSVLNVNEGENDQSVVTLDSTLSSKSSYVTNLASFDSLSYSGAPKLVWQNTDSGEIFVCYLTSREFDGLKSEMGKGEDVGERSPELDCKVWLLDGEGKVTSPYLKSTKGNEGCTVFDYDAEIIPTERFVERVSEILN